MSDRREVNVERPEHSWIPFYRELAEKLVNDGWRDKQGELVGMLKEMGANGLRMPPLLRKLDEAIDPITFMAMFNRNLNWNDNRPILDWIRGRFEISAISPLVDPWVPKSSRYVISTARDPESVWDLLATIIDQDILVEDDDLRGLMRQFDLCLGNIGISKLTAGMFWVKSEVFLHNDTVNAIGGKDLRIQARDAKSYFACLKRTKELARQSFPELNMSVFKTQNPESYPPKAWIVRGGRRAAAVEEFLTSGYTGVGFAFGDFDISDIRTVDELRRFCDERGLDQRGVDQVVQFLAEIEISDFILMPGRDSAVSYYGRVTSDPYHDRNGTHRNRRDVEWSENQITRDELDLSHYRAAVTKPNDEVRASFLKKIEQSQNRNVWIGIAQKAEFDFFLSGNLFGLKLALNHRDLSEVETKTAIKRILENQSEDRSEDTIDQYTDWWTNFTINLQIGDYVLMPSLDQTIVYFGEVRTLTSYHSDRIVRNCRRVIWHRKAIPISDLESFRVRNRQNLAERMLEADPKLTASFWRIKRKLESDGEANNIYGIEEMLDEDVFLEQAQIERMLRILRSKKNLILQGPPGVGKTFIAERLAYALIGRQVKDQVTTVQFHQSYSYEDFVGGYRPEVENDEMVFKPKHGPFLEICALARQNEDQKYVLLIDEINRGNLSRVFGEMLMLIEADKRKSEYAVKLQHQSKDAREFFVPENVYIIGTMNLADKSLTGMNVAMRRRFGFYDLEPQFGEPKFKDWLRKIKMPQEMQDRINSNMSKLNAAISKDDSLDFNYAVGHSFFCPPQNEPVDDWDEWYETVVDYEIRPLLREYWFDDPKRANDEADKLKRME